MADLKPGEYSVTVTGVSTSTDTGTPKVRKTPFLRHLCTKQDTKRSLCQDRLWTDIAKVENKRSFCAGAGRVCGAVRERFAPLYGIKTQTFAKTGSGQT
jgi:hypothetical protein